METINPFKGFNIEWNNHDKLLDSLDKKDIRKIEEEVEEIVKEYWNSGSNVRVSGVLLSLALFFSFIPLIGILFACVGVITFVMCKKKNIGNIQKDQMLKDNIKSIFKEPLINTSLRIEIQFKGNCFYNKQKILLSTLKSSLG